MLAALQPEDAETTGVLIAAAEGASVQELASRFQLTPAALKMRVMRARKRLRERLKRLRTGDLV